MKNPTIKTVSVTRRADRLENKTSERAAVRRHQAALRELDALERAAMMTAPVIKAMADQAGPIPGAGPRTATHPMATPMAPEPRPPMARRIRPPIGPIKSLIIQVLALSAVVLLTLYMADGL
jgi:hypothetical protein